MTFDPYPLDLGRVVVRDGDKEGDAVVVKITNSGDTLLDEISISVKGEAASNVQLAADSKRPVWAEVGRSIRPIKGELLPGSNFRIWARAAFSEGDDDGRHRAELEIDCISVGIG